MPRPRKIASPPIPVARPERPPAPPWCWWKDGCARLEEPGFVCKLECRSSRRARAGEKIHPPTVLIVLREDYDLEYLPEGEER